MWSMFSIAGLFFAAAFVVHFQNDLPLAGDGLTDGARRAQRELAEFKEKLGADYTMSMDEFADHLERRGEEVRARIAAENAGIVFEDPDAQRIQNAKDSPSNVVLMLGGAGILFMFGGLMKVSGKNGKATPENG